MAKFSNVKEYCAPNRNTQIERDMTNSIDFKVLKKQWDSYSPIHLWKGMIHSFTDVPATGNKNTSKPTTHCNKGKTGEFILQLQA